MSNDTSVELKKFVKQLNGASDKETLDILRLLKVQTITEAQLRETKAGLAVGKLRLHSNRAVADLAKEVVKVWKAAVEKHKSKTSKTSTPTATTPAAKPAPTPSTPTVTTTGVRSAKTDGVKGKVGDPTRDKCVELVYDALACDATAPIDRVLEKAHAVEKAVFNHFGGTTSEYKNKMRSLFVNLKDKSNPSLRASIVDGSIPADKLASMSAADMASSERKAADKKIEEENLFKSLSSTEQEAETDAFQCSRCKQRKCRYRQAQTRSADEPMTTFVTCTACGNKWKFS